MFEQRDKIFDMARSGQIDFQSSEYRKIRVSIEQNIRFAHQLTLTHLLFIAWSFKLFGKRSDDRGKSDLFAAVERIEDEELRAEIRRRVLQVHIYMIVMMICKSIIFWLLLPILLVATGIAAATTRLYVICKSALKYTGELIQIESECV